MLQIISIITKQLKHCLAEEPEKKKKKKKKKNRRRRIYAQLISLEFSWQLAFALNCPAQKFSMFEDFYLFVSILIHDLNFNLNLESSNNFKMLYFILIKEYLMEVAKL